jgi:hypothetical protein
MTMRRGMLGGLAVIGLTVIVSVAQEATPESEGSLVAQNVEITAERDLFGQVIRLAQGELINDSDSAFTAITLFAEVYNADEVLIGEGVGYPVDACGAGLLPDFALQPGDSQAFRVTLELYEPETDIDRVEVIPEAEATEAAETVSAPPLVGITTVSEQEVVSVEWLDDETLRFGIGCYQDVFTNLSWNQHNVDDGETFPIDHPSAGLVTDALIQQLGLTDPYFYNRSFLTFPLTSRRILYQDDINTVISAEPDGSFKRLIWDNLSRISLQGFTWLPEGRFLAYYFGASGEDVRYFTASAEGQRISGSVYDSLPSRIIPGPTPDGARAVIAATIDGVTGYFLQDVIFQSSELMFEAEPAGNNYPAPLYWVDEGDQRYVYIVRPEDDATLLQCYDFQSFQLSTLTTLPLQPDLQHRAWMWLSPDRDTLALAANGSNGGLWLLDLNELGRCGVGAVG